MEARKRKTAPHPMESANFLSYLTFTWIFSIFLSDYKERINAENIWNPYHSHKSEVVGDRLEKQWEKELMKKKNSASKQPSLKMALMKTFKFEFAYLALLNAVQCLTDAILRPKLLSIMLSYYLTNSKNADTKRALYAGIGLLLVTLLTNALMNHYLLWSFTLGLKMRASCVSLVYRKCLRLSKSAMGDISPGQIVNLVSNDVSRFDYAAMTIHYLWSAPLLSIIISYLLYSEVGMAGFSGMLVIFIIAPLQSFTAKLTTRYRRQIAFAADERIRLTDEVLGGIQVIKLYAWEKPFIKLLEEARDKELKVVRKANHLRGYYMTFGMFTRRMALFSTLLVYVLTGQHLSADRVFVVSAYFAILSVTMTGIFIRGIAEVSECFVSIKRLQAFLLRDEVEDNFLTNSTESEVKNDIKEDANTIKSISVNNVSASWNSASSDATLSNLNFAIDEGQVVGLIGSVGSGKSSVLHLLLKEMRISDGTVQVNGGVSYSAQEAWIFAGSVRDNILLGLPYERKRYNEVLHVCSLERDLELFPKGDMTMVGERGASLSGGQKARINLARAIYKEADIYLLDDPLSAVDPHVSKELFHQCIKGYLKGKTVILATHQLQVINNVDHIILLQSGQIEDQGTFKEFFEHGHDFTKQIALAMSMNDSNEQPTRKSFKRMLSCKSIRSVSLGGDEMSIASAYEYDVEVEEASMKEAEKEGSTNYKGNVYLGYVRNGSAPIVVIIYLFLLMMAQFFGSTCDIWVTHWTNSEESLTRNNITMTPEIAETNKNNMIIYGVLVVSLFLTAITRGMIFVSICSNCSKNLHTLLSKSVLSTDMSFFNKVPSGAILNRFAKDLGSTDEMLPKAILDSNQIFFQVLGAVITTMIVSVWLLIPVLIFTILIVIARKYYMKTSLNLKRLENMNRSPVFTHLNTTLQGLTTIRAHGSQLYLKREFDLHQDLHTTTLFTFLAAQQGYSFLLDLMGIIYLSCVVFLFTAFSSGVHGADVGLAISQTMVITGLLQWGMRQSSEVVNLMTSVERLLAFINLPPEETDSDKKSPPPNSWPKGGDIEFKHVTLTYDSEKSPVIDNLSFHVESGEKIGIVGRTGAGKSTLTSALFRLANYDGVITIDGVNIADISLQTLRSRIAIIPQNPILFSGNLRRNLDPFNEHPDYSIWRVLHELDLSEVLKDGHGLDTRISDGGSNLSMGERQLVCLARAIIRNSKIIVLDEATASVDAETDNLIQHIIRKKFQNCTVLTIAHRLNTVMDSDRILAMDAGNIVEFDVPYILMESHGSYLYRMVLESGRNMAAQLALQAEQHYLRKQQESLDE